MINVTVCLTCTTTAKWAATTDYNALTLTQKTTAEKIAPSVSFTGTPSSAADGSNFTVTASSNETGRMQLEHCGWGFGGNIIHPQLSWKLPKLG